MRNDTKGTQGMTVKTKNGKQNKDGTWDTPTGKHPGGVKTKFTIENKAKAEKLSRRGFTDKETAEIIDVSERSITRWKTKHPEFSLSLSLWKVESNGKVEKSLFERATGYCHPETKAQWVSSEGGGQWETIDMVKHYPPDATSMIFWLKNRDPERWKDKTEQDVTFMTIDDVIKKIEEKGEK